MGNRFSRQNEGVEDLESTSNPYRYPQLLGERPSLRTSRTLELVIERVVRAWKDIIGA